MKYSLCNDLLNSNKVIYCWAERVNGYLSGKRDFYPWSIEIHPTTRCNFRCMHCSYKERNREQCSLSESIMDELIDSAIRMKVKGVYFSGGGEPALYNNLRFYIRKLYENGVHVALITNGSLLNESGITEIAHMIDYIAISVPSCDAYTYNKITGSCTLHKVLEIPEQIKGRHGSRSPVIGARTIITNMNYMDLEAIMFKLREKHFDYSLFKVVRDYEGVGLALSPGEEEQLRLSIAKMEAGKKIDEAFTNIHKVFNFKAEIEFSNVCVTNEMAMIANVNTDGRVYPSIAEIGSEEFCIGNLNEKSFDLIWNSETHKNVKKNSNEKWKSGQCRNCRAIMYNMVIDKTMQCMPQNPDPFI